jgi:8-oxo-dGTP diphosphatase
MKQIAGVITKQDGKYLLVQERQERCYGQWNLPAGHVDEGESPEEAAKREGYEETGYTFEIVGTPHMFTFEDRGAVIHLYPANITGGEMKFDASELLDVRWFTVEEIQHITLREPAFLRLFT